MLTSSFFTVVVAAFASVAAAQTTTDITTTSTSTMTRTITITTCNPTVTDCPALKHNSTTVDTSSSSSSSFYPAANLTSAFPTAYANKTTSYSVPSPTVKTSTEVVIATTSASSTPTTGLPTAGAGGLVVQSGLLLGLLGAGIALLA